MTADALRAELARIWASQGDDAEANRLLDQLAKKLATTGRSRQHECWRVKVGLMACKEREGV